MYWRRGLGFVVLWIASLTLALGGLAAAAMAGSRGAALSFLAAGTVLAPPVQELISTLRHQMAPAKAALLSCITLIPIGLGFLTVDLVARLETEAQRRGFASAGQLSRARELNLATPAALLAHDQAARKAALDQVCRQNGARPPLACFDGEHQRSALAFVEAQIGADELGAIARDALAQLHKAYLDADKGCAALIERIDEDALPVILQSKPAMIALAAAIWARHLSRAELEELVARAKPGVSYLSVGGGEGIDRKLGQRRPLIEKELDAEFQAWARRIAQSEPGWQAFFKGRGPLGNCRPAEQASQKATR